MNRSVRLAITTALLAAGWAAGIAGQSPSIVLADGGIQFPDGTVQTTAGVSGAPVQDTGQMQCFDGAGNSRACRGTGEDGELLVGVEWPTPRLGDNADGTVTDLLTGLVWLKDARCFASSDWQESLDQVVRFNTLSIPCQDYLGLTFSDWRLPNIRELLSLVDWGRDHPSLPSPNPFANTTSAFYWSSSTRVESPARAWGVSFSDGNPAHDDKAIGHSVWLVRGGAR